MTGMSSFDQWIDQFVEEWVRETPQAATVSQYFPEAEQQILDSRLTLTNGFGGTCGMKIAQRRASLARRGLDELKAFAATDLEGEQHTSAAMITWYLETVCATAPFAHHRFIFEQFTGLHISFVTFLANLHPIRNHRDVENYLARLDLVAPCIDEGIAEAQAAAEAGIIPPRFIIERTIEQLDQLIHGPLEEHPLLAPFDARLSSISTISPAQKLTFMQTARERVCQSILSAFGRIRTMLQEQLPNATDHAGAWALPNGAEYYARQLAASTGLTFSAQEIHEIGLREVARIESEMEKILQALGYHEGSVPQRLEQLNELHRWPETPDPRENILKKLAEIIQDAERRSPSVFTTRPQAPVIVQREPAFSEKSAAAHYSLPKPDGSQPGIYWVPLADIGPKVPWLGIGLKSTAYHEAIPGHHFQLAILQECTHLPRFRKLRAFGYNPAFEEGWALYAEHLCAEYDWYADDLAGRLGYLEMQLFRARRLVVDTGLHALRWTREKAIAYGFTAAEIERYVVWPGQACSYMLGQLHIMELRERAKKALGSTFSISRFHDYVLKGGTVPLTILSTRIDAWIQEEKLAGSQIS